MGFRSSVRKGQVLLVLLLSQALLLNVAASQAGHIDIFTQKEPFDGYGSHTPSDAFHPGEKVLVHALVDLKAFLDQGLEESVLALYLQGLALGLVEQARVGQSHGDLSGDLLEEVELLRGILSLLSSAKVQAAQDPILVNKGSADKGPKLQFPDDLNAVYQLFRYELRIEH